jgi:hypothetical protein
MNIIIDEFDGQYFKFDGKSMKLNSPDGTAIYALEEVKIFKKIVRLQKKEITEKMRIIRAEAAAERISNGPASLSFGALFFKGTKLGALSRTWGSLSRASDRQKVNNILSPYEEAKQQLEIMLMNLERFEIALRKEIIANVA